jgi:hypothetical protein
LRERATLGVQHVRDHDLRAGACERPRLGRSLAAAAAGDENGLVLEILLHGVCPHVDSNTGKLSIRRKAVRPC